MRKYLAFMLVVGLAYGEFSIAQSQKHVDKGGDTTQTTQADKRGTQASPFVVNAHPIQSDTEAAEESARDAEQKRVNGWLIGLTFGLVVCAVLQAVGIGAQVLVYLKQTKIMRGTLRKISEQATTMATQAQDAKDAATAAALTTQSTLTAIERQAELMKQSADISRGATVPTLRILKFSMIGSDPLVDNEMELTVRNYGATPAILDIFYISFDDGERWPAEEGESVSYSDPGGRAIAANSEGILRSSPYMCLVSPDQIERFRRQMKSLYVHGRLKYRDVFDSPARNLRFDVHLSPTQNWRIRCEITGQWNEYDKPENPN